MCRCLLVCLFTVLTYTLHSSICFHCWCGVGRNCYWFTCGETSSLCMRMIIQGLFRSQLTVFSPSSPHALALSCCPFVSFFLLLNPHFHIPASSLLAKISLGLHLPSFTARSPRNPPRTINIVWEHSLGKHEPKGLSISHTFYLATPGVDSCDISFSITVICVLSDSCNFMFKKKTSIFISCAVEL